MPNTLDLQIPIVNMQQQVPVVAGSTLRYSLQVSWLTALGLMPLVLVLTVRSLSSKDLARRVSHGKTYVKSYPGDIPNSNPL